MNQTKFCPKCKTEKPTCDFYKSKQGDGLSGWCKTCFVKLTNQRTVEKKKQMLMMLGGKCSKCGYDKNYAALDFHHKDPSDKEFSISKIRWQSLDKIIPELNKCIILCRNCHSEHHYPHAQNWRKDEGMIPNA